MMVPPAALLRVAEMMEGAVVATDTILPCASRSRFCCRASLCCFSCCSSWALSWAALTDVVCWIVVVSEPDFSWMAALCLANLKFVSRFYMVKYGSYKTFPWINRMASFLNLLFPKLFDFPEFQFFLWCPFFCDTWLCLFRGVCPFPLP